MVQIAVITFLVVLATPISAAEVFTVQVESGSSAAVSVSGLGSPLFLLDLADEEDTLLAVNAEGFSGFELLFFRVVDTSPFESLNIEIGSIADGIFIDGGAPSIVFGDYETLFGSPTPTGLIFGPLDAEGTLGLLIAGPPDLGSFALRFDATFVSVPEPAAVGLLALASLLGRPRRA